MSASITKHLPKARRRPSIRGHKGIERGSPAAARLFWEDADAIGRAAGDDELPQLPKFSRYGFEGPPSPPDNESRERSRSWYRRERERSRASSMKMTPEQRAWMFWGAVDHRVMFGQPPPDPYVFGYDEFPTTRPAEHPEPPYVQEMRAIREQTAHLTVGDALTAFGLTSAATAEDVNRAYRKIVSSERLHPDQGGNPAAFARFTATRDRVLQLIADQAL